MYNSDGRVKNCIRSSGFIGSLMDNSISDILHSNINQQTKHNMLSVTPGPNCSPCYSLEENKKSFDIISDRIFYLKELKAVPLHTYDSPDNFKLSTIDVRWSNVCNFACVYCGPKFSSKWAAELGTQSEEVPENRLQELRELVYSNTESLQHVYLAGGEPLLMKENYELLTKLQKSNPNIQLRINTNLSKVDTKIFDLICSFKNVHWIVSVETMEQEYEYIRFGGKWADFLDNLDIIRSLGHKITFNMLYFILNYWSLFDCIEFFSDMGFHNNAFVVGPLLTPKELTVSNLPESEKSRLREHITQMLNKQPGYLLQDGLQNILGCLDAPSGDIAVTFKALADIDRRRHLDSKVIFPGLYRLGKES